MAIMGALLMESMVTEGSLGVWVGGAVVAALCVLATGTATLTALVRYTAKQSAAHGVRRDVRRATMHVIHRALKQGRSQVDLRKLNLSIKQTFASSWKGLKLVVIDAEIQSVCADLGIGPSLDQDVTSASDATVYDVRELQMRYQAGDAHDAVFDFESMNTMDPSQDKIVFDTQIEHDHVTHLGLNR
jgi:hypothetical protein